MQELVAEVTGPYPLGTRRPELLPFVFFLFWITAARRAHVLAWDAENHGRGAGSRHGLNPAQVESLLAIERTPRGLPL